MVKYGLISRVDADVIEKTLDKVASEFPEEDLFTTEIGVYSGETSLGICQFLWNKGRKVYHTGIDNKKDDEPMVKFPLSATFINGNSNEVYSQLNDNSQHFIFIDGCHCFPHVVSDYYCYRSKIRRGGYLAFHDTGSHIKPLKDFQHGDKRNPDAYISVRKALVQVGLLDGRYDSIWQLVFDEADLGNEAGGICVFKRTA